MAMTEFGGLIREGRERLGLSPNRVAELIGRASGTVKAWERGRTVPSDPTVVTSLAAVLAIDEGQLFRSAGLTPPGMPPQPTIEQELASIAPQRRPEPESVAPAAEPTVERTAVVTDEQPVIEKPVETGRMDEPETDAVGEFLAKAAEGVRNIRFPTFERRQRTPRPDRERVRAVPLQGSPIATATSAQSYLEDTEERWAYRLRVIWTVAGLGGLGVVALWAGAHLFEAIGDTIDALLAGL